MARLTRQSARLSAAQQSPATTTNSTANPSPAFSTISSHETPPTSDDELPILLTKKRPLQQDEPEQPSRKRRAPAKQVFVEIVRPSRAKTMPVKPIRTAAKGKGKARAQDSSPSSDDEIAFLESPTKNKGKGKAVESAPASDYDCGLEYDEKAELFESEDSGSEFIGSDDDDPIQAVDEDDEEDIDDDTVMIDAAIQMSLETQNSVNSTKLVSPNPQAILRARAAEARIASAKNGKANLVDDSSMVLDASDSEEEVPLRKKKAPKKTKKVQDEEFDDELSAMSSEEYESDAPISRGKGKSKVTIKPKAKSMTMAELRRQRKQERLRKRAERRVNIMEERALRKKLGRKLTYAEKSTIALHKHHPELRDVWGDLEAKIPILVPQPATQPANLKLTLLPFQRESLSWMQKQEKGVWSGGMLADEMGMGKTIQMIALLVADGGKPNLVVAPTVAIMQWKNEIAAHTHGLEVLVWHGAARQSDPKELKKFDVVLTTYAVMESCFRKQEQGFKRKGMIVKEKSPIHRIEWNRIILDEAHNIKERSTNTAKAAFELKARGRWCLSGTPLQNRVGELYSLVRFLGGDPFSFYYCKKCDCKSLHWRFSDKRSCDDCGHSPMQHTCFWNNEILTPIQKYGMAGPGQIAFKKLKILLDRMMLRRTKLQRADDLGLPPRTVIVRRDYFSPEERELYLSLFSDVKRRFDTYLEEGTILNNYSNIFSLLTRMRQMACHPDLVIRSKKNANSFLPTEPEATVCRLCNDVAEDAIQSKCRHIFDRECIKQYLNTAIEQQPDCPVCHLPLTIDLDAPALELEQNVPDARQGILGRLNLEKWRSSTKIEALLEELVNLRMKDATTKSLVFSQFVNFLDLIAYRLQGAGFKICRLEGTMSPQARDATIKHFMENVEVTVFLVSLKAGGVALNLTEASRVYLMDSWWNPAVEFQAMDRIHRLGQKRPVKAIKLVVEDSIESRIVQLQEKKSAMVDATLSTDDQAMGRLTPQDLQFLFRL
ncbi:ATP-dependent helicase rhp16 [Mycena indigotica]|uniref:ATP-dependent helicase rhp16 n=1 Tax=Mycena indigotica TaxID=2126181 RepID=A0A8H6SEK7_9AGAR|nr:ATP-dependent helicase rhp16 [Mycena indigotica]KAF7297296.1 ATP-dependent helicase rhp16 [Mycena indigotica]